MKKKVGSIREEIIEMSKGSCEYCGKTGTELHHVFGGRGKRKDLESIETVVWLCSECHRGKNSWKVINHYKEKVCGDLFKKYGEEEARRLCGGKFYVSNTM